MENKFIAIATVLLILVGGIFLVRGDVEAGAGNVIKNTQGSGDIQEIHIGMRNYNYYPNSITVKANAPVRIYLDDSVYGCYRSFTIRDFGVSKYLQKPNDYVEFTPTKTGTYTFSCSMGMGRGTLIVE